MHALDKQVGGTHYMTLDIQPFTFGMRMATYDQEAAMTANKLAEYLVRGKGKDDLEKAVHVVELFFDIREELIEEEFEPYGYEGNYYFPRGSVDERLNRLISAYTEQFNHEDILRDIFVNLCLRDKQRTLEAIKRLEIARM